ncbi:hypothetical protein EVAR_14634_1 [Eumeta japonica]|uniref:Uncharacterized protein n=1 Tax=Eumeta variegata TaxID=151549 RepID=A0A4C1U1Z8_EUMVA|nr:hypothetical protein EVAR_14634_1 [Eumeta japonica]
MWRLIENKYSSCHRCVLSVVSVRHGHSARVPAQSRRTFYANGRRARARARRVRAHLSRRDPRPGCALDAPITSYKRALRRSPPIAVTNELFCQLKKKASGGKVHAVPRRIRTRDGVTARAARALACARAAAPAHHRE